MVRFLAAFLLIATYSCAHYRTLDNPADMKIFKYFPLRADIGVPYESSIVEEPSAEKISGSGEMIYADGSSYDGQWSNSLREGRGRLINADGTEESGTWRKDRLVN